MKLAMRMPPKSGLSDAANDVDPRDGADAEIIDLAQRNSFPVVAANKGRSEGSAWLPGSRWWPRWAR
jgi:type IV secretion system protein VirB10